MCACRLTENEHKKRQKVQKEKDEIGENRENGKRIGGEWIGPKITGKKTENNGKSAFLIHDRLVGLVERRPPQERKIPGSNSACAGIFRG